MPEDLFTDALSEGNFLVHALAMLARTLRTRASDVPPPVRAAAVGLLRACRARFGWEVPGAEAAEAACAAADAGRAGAASLGYSGGSAALPAASAASIRCAAAARPQASGGGSSGASTGAAQSAATAEYASIGELLEALEEDADGGDMPEVVLLMPDEAAEAGAEAGVGVGDGGRRMAE
jgi:hypothetical protein